MWLIIVFMIGVKAFGLRSFGPVRRQSLQTVCSGSVHNPRITSMACSTCSNSDHTMGMPDEGDRGLNNENGEGDEEGFDASATASSNGIIFSDDFKQMKRKRGKFVSSRDRRRDRMINTRSRPNSFSGNQEDASEDDVEMRATSSRDYSHYQRRKNGVEFKTVTEEESATGQNSGPMKLQNTGNAPSSMSETQKRGGKPSGATNMIVEDTLPKDTRREAAGSAYSISGKQTRLHANDVYCRFLNYDHLSSHSLDTIEVSSNRIPKHKNLAYISRWWRGAKKWDILGKDLEEIENAYRNASTDSTPSSMMYDDSDNNNNNGGDGTTSEASVSRRLPRAMYEAIREHCAAYKARVICVGDVHGCADELRDLLRKINYRPSDVVVLLGDLVAKGPKSGEVIQMAIDLNAMSVRGNHDQEVIRRSVTWRSSLKHGKATEKLKYNEHTRIAKELTPAQWSWLTELPYFIRSDDLAALFVHAGFQSNLRLTDQDPWVMMTMRSLLPGLRASARCDYRFPWASLWKGPMTVYFGHDAARGLQVYNHAVGLDTGCVYGAELTAMILPDKELVAVRARNAYQDMRKSRSHKSLAATGPSEETESQSNNQKGSP